MRGWRLTLVLSKSVAITSATNIVFTRIMLAGPVQDARRHEMKAEMRQRQWQQADGYLMQGSVARAEGGALGVQLARISALETPRPGRDGRTPERTSAITKNQVVGLERRIDAGLSRPLYSVHKRRVGIELYRLTSSRTQRTLSLFSARL